MEAGHVRRQQDQAQFKKGAQGISPPPPDMEARITLLSLRRRTRKIQIRLVEYKSIYFRRMADPERRHLLGGVRGVHD